MIHPLFPDEQSWPDGFSYIPCFITEKEETELSIFVEGIELHTFTFRGFEAKRRVISYGYDYNFDNRSIRKGEPIPAAFNALTERVAQYLSIPPTDFAELLVTEYPPGAVINWHRDAPPFDLIVGISLLTDCTFKLRPYDKVKQTRDAIISFPVARRSLYIMKNTVRSEWEHSIAPVKHKRYSLTLRTLRKI